VKSNLPSLMALVLFLASLGACAAAPEPEATSRPAQTVSVETFLPSEVRTIFRRSCESCHGPDSKGIAGVAPSLLRRSERSTEEWIRYFSEIPGAPTSQSKRPHPGALLPSTIWMTTDEIKMVAVYLANRNGQASPSGETP
jgi:mono/diheme cytochrome c family protein